MLFARMHSAKRTALLVAMLLAGTGVRGDAGETYDLAFSTLFGGSAGEMIRDVEVDGRGNIYAAGTTRSADFPTTPGAYHEHLDGSQGTSRWGYNSDVFVAKFSPTGKLLWSTLVGGPNSEEAYGLEIDSKGYVIVHGRGAEGSPVTPGVYQPQFKGCGGGDPGNPHNSAQNAYICKLSPDGSTLVWASFFGIDHLHRDLALDKNDDLYITWGVRPEENDPRHWDNWMDPAWNAHAFQPRPLGKADGGVAKIASDGRRVIWATYLGGSDYDSIEASIDVDSQSFVYVGLQTRSKDIPTTTGAFDRTYNGGVDWYIAKLSPDGSRLVYGTYIGDEGDNFLNTHNLVVDREGNCYSSICAANSSFPTTPGAVQRNFGGKVDWGIIKLSPTGALLAGTLLGGIAGDNPDGIRIDPQGNLVLFGQTGSANFPVSRDAYQSTKGAGNDAVIVKLHPSLDRLVYSTFLGGSGDDNGRSGCVGTDGSLIVAGTTSGGDWPTRNAWQNQLKGPSDTMIARLSVPSPLTDYGRVFDCAKAELHGAVQDGRIAGGVHWVVRDGRTLHCEAAGFRDIEDRTPFTVDSILRIYSMSKPITSVAAMMLFEQGKFALDDPVARFIPAFTNATVLETIDGQPCQVPPKRSITVRDVLRHTTGYSYGDEPSVREFYERAGLRYWGPQELFPPRMSIAQAADALARVPALHHPGEKFTYGFSTDLLGRLIEVWSGEPLDRYLQRAVFEPLEMADTGFSVPREKRSRFASCYTLREGKLAVLDSAASSPFHHGFEFLSGGGGLVSTTRDYANFCQMLVDAGRFKGRRLLKPETLQLMYTDQLHGVDGVNRFGLGFAMDDVELGSGAGQRKVAGYRWGGYASTQFAVIPEERLFQIFALQQVPYTEEPATTAFRVVYDGLPVSTPSAREPSHWSQFRGPNGQGAAPDAQIPLHFGPETNVLWKLAIPPGHSSPVIWGNLLFLTATEATNQHTLLTLAIDRRDGRVLWRQEVQSEQHGVFHQLNNPASSTPAADDRHVYVYFGTYGLICYDHAGNPVWQRRLATPKSKYGMATSPILYHDTVILVQDGDDGRSRLLALCKNTGETVWEQPRVLFKAGWSTPIVFRHGAADDLIVLGSRRLTAYDPGTGQERWWAGGFPEETVGVPATADGLLFASGAALGGRGDEDLDAAATWRMTIAEFDRNRDGQIQRDEMTPGFAFIQRPELSRDNPGYGLPVKDMDVLLKIFDHDKEGSIAEAEWMQTMAGFAAISHPTLMALRPGAIGDARPTHVAWELRRGVPETSSLLCNAGRLYLMRDGGVLTCLEAATGRERFRERIGASGQYIASPIVAGDRLLVASVKGVITVIQMADTLMILARNDLGEDIYATPAVAGDQLYVRTVGHLLAFGP